MIHKTTWLLLILCAPLSSAPLLAQAPDLEVSRQNDASHDDPEEIVVRGRRLSDFRFALEAARVRVYDVFNALNGDDAFDVRCEAESSTGTRMRQRICRPRFKNDISSAAAQAWVHGLLHACGGLTGYCIFSEAAQSGMSRAQAEESKEPLMQQRFAQEMARVVAGSAELQQAILDYQALERAFEEARSGKR
jgi:hypothetical protein